MTEAIVAKRRAQKSSTAQSTSALSSLAPSPPNLPSNTSDHVRQSEQGSSFAFEDVRGFEADQAPMNEGEAKADP